MAAKKKRALEWVGGLGLMPSYVTGEGEPFRPEILLWLNAEGAILGTEMARPSELVRTAGEHLSNAMERPTFGPPQTPARVRVASPELADVLRASHPAIDVVLAPTPEIDDVLANMREMMSERESDDESYLAPDIGEEAMAAFFQAAAGLFRAKPWDTVPDDQSLFSVTIEALDMREAVMSVIGQMGQSHGLVFFRGMDDFDAYLDAAAAIEEGRPPRMPPHFALNFDRGADVSKALRKEVAKHRWKLAGPNAYPSVIAVDEDLVARPPTALELRIVEAIALAMPKVLAGGHGALDAAFHGGEPVTRTVAVDTSAGAVDVTIRAPYERRPGRPTFDVLADLFDLDQDEDGIDPERREELEETLVEAYLASPEARSGPGIKACRLVMDLAADYLGMTIATLGPRDLREILFEIVPRKVSVDASEARALIEQTRAFYTFLKRAYGLEQADACLRELGANAVKRLEEALSRPSNFGMAKSIFMAGAEAGFDMKSQEGIEAFMRAMEGKPLPASIPLSPFGSPAPRGGSMDKGGLRAKKNQRKAARKARKKSR
jgi:hypothetical protein